MNTTKALETIRKWIIANVENATGVFIYNDMLPEPTKGDDIHIAIQPSPAPSKVFNFITDGENGIPNRRVERVFNFMVRAKNATIARNLAEEIVTKMDGSTLLSNTTEIDCFNPVLSQFITTDDKNNSSYTSAITCQYDITEKE